MKKILGIILVCFLILSMTGCGQRQSVPSSATGVQKVNANIKVQSNGYTIEQENVLKRLKIDNTPGTIKHLYVISAYSGQVLIYSTVQGKVTSSGKRLTPYSVAAIDGDYVSSSHYGVPVTINGRTHYTAEVLQDDGTYGSSIEYLYWWDATGKYHQHYVSGGQIIHVSDQPLVVPEIIINMDITK